MKKTIMALLLAVALSLLLTAGDLETWQESELPQGLYIVGPTEYWAPGAWFYQISYENEVIAKTIEKALDRIKST